MAESRPIDISLIEEGFTVLEAPETEGKGGEHPGTIILFTNPSAISPERNI